MNSSHPGLFSLQGSIDRIHKKIISYDRTLKKHPNNALIHYMKATAFTELAELDTNINYSEQAINFFNKAIDFDPENPLFLIERAKFFLKSERYDLAKADAEKVTLLIQNPEITKFINEVVLMDINNSLRNVIE